MYFYNIIKNLSDKNKILIFVDMDGVVTDYDFGNTLNFKNKRPIMTNIKTLEKISKIENVEIEILSICKTIEQVKDKNEWLDKYLPFIAKDKRNILAKVKYPNISSKEIKCRFLKDYKNNNKQIIVIDDDNEILKFLKININDIILFQDSSIID